MGHCEPTGKRAGQNMAIAAQLQLRGLIFPGGIHQRQVGLECLFFGGAGIEFRPGAGQPPVVAVKYGTAQQIRFPVQQRQRPGGRPETTAGQAVFDPGRRAVADRRELLSRRGLNILVRIMDAVGDQKARQRPAQPEQQGRKRISQRKRFFHRSPR